MIEYRMARTEEWLDMKWFHEAIQDMPSLYKEKCLPFLFLREQIDRFLDPRVGLTEQIASFLKLEAGESPTLYCHPAQPSDDGTPKDLSLEVNQFTSLLNLEVARMNNFLVSTHRSQARAANVSDAAATICFLTLSFICLLLSVVFLIADSHTLIWCCSITCL